MFDKKYIFDLAKEILSIDSPSGFTTKVTSRIEEEANKFHLKSEYTKKGNLLVYMDGKGDYSLGITSHVDTLGLMVRSISDTTLKLTAIGGPIVPTLDGVYCKIYTRDNKIYTGTVLSTSPAVHVYKDANSKIRDIDNIEVRIDEIVKTKEDIKALGIENGNFVCYDQKTEITESGFIKSRFLDDKLSVACIFGYIDYMQKNKLTPKQNIVFIFSTYEEVGHGASYIPKVDEILACDMGCVGDDLDCTEYDVSICAKDSSGPYNYEMTSKLVALAKEEKLNYAVDIYPFYGSDASAAMRAGNDAKHALIGPGVHASHGMERYHVDGIINTIKLMVAYTTK
jgi:putative aminopeptidase FrvX